MTHHENEFRRDPVPFKKIARLNSQALDTVIFVIFVSFVAVFFVREEKASHKEHEEHKDDLVYRRKGDSRG